MLRPTAAALVQFCSVDPVQFYHWQGPIDDSEKRNSVNVASKIADWIPIFLSCSALQTLRIKTPVSNPGSRIVYKYFKRAKNQPLQDYLGPRAGRLL
jgi:hypothetical protein